MKEYQTIYMLGAECYTDAYIAAPPVADGCPWYILFISLFGRVGVVKAVAAAILNRTTVYINDHPAARPHDRSDMKTMTQQLGQGVCQKVVFCPRYFKSRTRIILGEDRERAFALLQETVSTPLKREWADWVWSKVFQPQPLIGFGRLDGRDLSSALMITQDKTSKEVDELVLEALRSGEGELT